MTVRVSTTSRTYVPRFVEWVACGARYVLAMPDDDLVLYRRDGDLFVPTPLTGGPWDPGAQAGSATTALLAWAVEQVPTLAPMRTVRYTFDLLRPAPMVGLDVRTEVVREGKRIQVVEAGLYADDVCVASCRALRMRQGSAAPPVAEDPSLPVIAAPPPPGVAKWGEPMVRTALPGIMGALDVREPVASEPAWPTTTWVRLLASVVEGTSTPQVAALAAIADFVSNSANHAGPEQWMMINADVSLDIVRVPSSDWMALEVRTSFAPDGIGHSVGRIHDESGFVATAMTMGLVDRRG
ncbi:thioesterase family protein [soil metagenome]